MRATLGLPVEGEAQLRSAGFQVGKDVLLWVPRDRFLVCPGVLEPSRAASGEKRQGGGVVVRENEAKRTSCFSKGQ